MTRHVSTLGEAEISGSLDLFQTAAYAIKQMGSVADGSHRQRPRRWLARAVLAASFFTALGATLAVPQTASAQESSPSAADKATARITATEGIQLFREEKYAEALDRFKRAQQLYDAPVHLVYIARCQRRLGALVEAAEVYRTLSKQQLASDAPPAFVNAVADGRQELSELEPLIPQVVIRVVPADATDLKLSLDGKDIPVAVVGIKRPLNPGRRTLRVEANGFEPDERVIEANEGDLLEVAVNLKPVPKQVSATDEPVVDDTATEDVEAKPQVSQSPLHTVALLLGARLGLAVPTGSVPGQVAHPRLEDEVRFKRLAKVGADAEVRIGAHFFDRWSVLGFFSVQGLNDADGTFEVEGAMSATGAMLPASRTDPGAPTVSTVGFAVAGGTPRGQFGGFGEFGFGIVRRMTMSTVGAGTGSAGVSCEANVTATGSALRLSAGLNIPLRRRLLHLTPYATAQFGGVNEVKYTTTSDCPNVIPDATISTKDGDYATISFGVGGEFFIGGN